MGFGFASLIAGPAMQILVQSFGLVANFIILGIVYMVIMTASSLYLAPPEEDSAAAAEKKSSVEYADAQPQFTVRDSMKTWQFYAIWWLFFTNITCGIALLAVASPMAQDVVGMSPMQRLRCRPHRPLERCRPYCLGYRLRLYRPFVDVCLILRH